MAQDYFGLAGTDDLAGKFFTDPYGRNGVSLSEAADVADGSYDYNGTANGGIVSWQNDAQEQGRIGPYYPSNGNPWWDNAAVLGVSRAIDSATRAYATVKGAQAATYAGQNGITYTNGRQVVGISTGGMLPLLLLGVAVFLIAKK